MIGLIELNALLDFYPVLRNLPPHLRQAVQQQGACFKAPAGQVMFDVGTPCRAFIMIISGAIDVSKPAETGREILLYRVQTSESCILTVSCLLGNAEYPARGIAKSDLLGVSVPQALFIQLVEQSPTFRTFIFHFFGERLSRLMALIEEVAFRKLDQRLAALLLNNGGVLEATHQKLADELGSVREVISRILADFQGQGMVQLERGQIRVLDKAGLERMASTM